MTFLQRAWERVKPEGPSTEVERVARARRPRYVSAKAKPEQDCVEVKPPAQCWHCVWFGTHGAGYICHRRAPLVHINPTDWCGDYKWEPKAKFPGKAR